MALTAQTIKADRNLRQAISLIKEHISADETKQNIDLHRAVGLIVDVAREYNLLDHNWSARLYAELASASPMMYACDACASDIENGGISDDAGHLALTGRNGNFYALCALCGAAATHEVTHLANEAVSRG